MGVDSVGKREYKGEESDNREFDQLQVLQEGEMILNNLITNINYMPHSICIIDSRIKLS